MFLRVRAFCTRPIAALLLIVAAGIIVYSNTFQVPFTFDDDTSIVENREVKVLENFFVGHNGFPHRYVGYLTFSLNHHFSGLDVTGYHLANLLIHLAAALLVYRLLRLTFSTPFFQRRGAGEAEPGPSDLEPGSRFIPLLAALLFVVHPVQTQAVTYIVQRFTSLAAMFYLLSVVLYVEARLRIESRVPSPGSDIPNLDLGPGTLDSGRWTRSAPILFLAGATASAVLAMKTKEIACTLPMAIVLYEVFFFRGEWKRRLLCLLPLLATLPIVPVTVFIIGDSAGDVLSDISEKVRAHTAMSRMDYLLTQFRVIVTYLRLLVLPVNQNLDYDYPVYTTFFTPPVFLSFLLLAVLFLLALWLFHNSKFGIQNSAFRLISFGILWFFLTLAVESSIVPIVDVIFEHRLYLPGFGAATAFASAFFLIAGRLVRRPGERLLAAGAALIVLSLAVAAFQRNHVWGDELRLWGDTAAKSPEKGRPLNNLAVALEDAGRRAEAVEVLHRSIEVEPTYYRAYYNLGDLYLVSGYPQEALLPFQEAIRLKPDFTLGYVRTGAALLRSRQFREAADFLEGNLERVDDHAEARFYLGAAYAFLGETQNARRELAIVSRLDAALASDLAGLLALNSTHGSSHARQ